MKTKDNDKKSRSRGVKESRSTKPRTSRCRCVPTAARQAAGHSSTFRLLNYSTMEFSAQSEDVYEKKGQGQKVEKSRSRGVEEYKTRNQPLPLRSYRSATGGGSLFDFSTPQLLDYGIQRTKRGCL